MSSLPKNFTVTESEELIKRVPAKFYGKLRSLFVVLSDDLARSRFKSAKKSSGSAGSAAATNESDSEADEDEPPAPPVPAVLPGQSTSTSQSSSSRKRPPSPHSATNKKSNKKSSKWALNEPIDFWVFSNDFSFILLALL